jgi:hypothetical protein
MTDATDRGASRGSLSRDLGHGGAASHYTSACVDPGTTPSKAGTIYKK